jgi:hypothetical protein
MPMPAPAPVMTATPPEKTFSSSVMFMLLRKGSD